MLKCHKKNLEIWGGIECTRNRIKNTFFDQLVRSGHENRISDLHLIAALQLKTLRYPFLWERVQPQKSVLHWDWVEKRIKKLNDLKIEPIVGLLHHGSGPSFTQLLDPEFPTQFANYAYEFAKKFPQLRQYNPINEPLTTARFSCLYGFWYPHRKNHRDFSRAFINQIRAIVLAMQKIREIQPAAVLIQTEDLGRVSGRPALQYQIDFENERRWLTYDLLSGQFSSRHLLWNYFTENGVSEAELRWFQENICPPEILGINHYATSNRYLDERRLRFPKRALSGNGKNRYADIEAVHSDPKVFFSIGEILKEAWSRYHLPLAITESHLGSTRDEQLRWLAETWQTASALRKNGLDIRAVTIWALLGCYDWNSLCRYRRGYYESGVFDLNSKSSPRTTALAPMVSAFANQQSFDHPVFDSPGFWQRPDRVRYGLKEKFSSLDQVELVEFSKPNDRKILFIGSDPLLFSEVAKICNRRGLSHLMSNSDRIEQQQIMRKCWAIVDLSALSNQTKSVREKMAAHQKMAAVAKKRNIPFVIVFPELYSEKIDFIPKMDAQTLVIESGKLFNPCDGQNFVSELLSKIRFQKQIEVSDEIVEASYLPDLIDHLLNLLIDGESGVWRLVNSGKISEAKLALHLARRFKEKAEMSICPSETPMRGHVELKGKRYFLMRPLTAAIDRWILEQKRSSFKQRVLAEDQLSLSSSNQQRSA